MAPVIPPRPETRRARRDAEAARRRRNRRRIVIAGVSLTAVLVGGTGAMAFAGLTAQARAFTAAETVADSPALAEQLTAVVTAAESALSDAPAGVDTAGLQARVSMLDDPARVPAATADAVLADVESHTETVTEESQRVIAAEQARKAAEEKAAADAAAAAAAALAQSQTPEGAQALAQQLAADNYGWGSDQYGCLYLLWNKESTWNYQAENPSSGAYGIPQALPGSKMSTVAADWETNPATQIAWGLQYINSVYGSPCAAWGHSQAVNWY